MSGAAIVASIAGDMVGDEDAISGFNRGHESSGLDDNAGWLVAQHERRFFYAVPFQKIGTAEAAGHDFEHNVPVAGLRFRTFFHPYITVAIIDADFHKVLLLVTTDEHGCGSAAHAESILGFLRTALLLSVGRCV